MDNPSTEIPQPPLQATGQITDAKIRRQITSRNTVSAVSDSEILDALNHRPGKLTADDTFQVIIRLNQYLHDNSFPFSQSEVIRVLEEHKELLDLIEP